MPRRPIEDGLTPGELELMNILWAHGPSTVQEVVRRLPPDRPLAYTTVQTVLNVLHRKKKVGREYRNRAYCYHAAVSQSGAAISAVRTIVSKLFGGSPQKLVLTMVESEQLTPAEIEDLQRLLDAELDRRKEGK